MPAALVNFAYLIAAVLFILGLKGLAHPRTAVRGNFLGALGMFIAIVVTLFNKNIIGFETIIAGIVVGSAIGAIVAVKIQMTAIPQMVALFNGFGGGASALVAGAALIEALLLSEAQSGQFKVATVASGCAGYLSALPRFWGYFWLSR